MEKTNNYKIYKRIHSQDEYFSFWEQEKLKDLDDELKDIIYTRYVLKCNVFQRDNFKCQNEKCKCRKTSLELHHIIPRSLGGADNYDNCVILCNECHTNYHSGKEILYMNGEPYKADNFERMQRRKLKIHYKKFREELKISNPELMGHKLSPEMIAILLNFLNYYYKDIKRNCDISSLYVKE